MEFIAILIAYLGGLYGYMHTRGISFKEILPAIYSALQWVYTTLPILYIIVISLTLIKMFAPNSGIPVAAVKKTILRSTICLVLAMGAILAFNALYPTLLCSIT